MSHLIFTRSPWDKYSYLNYSPKLRKASQWCKVIRLRAGTAAPVCQAPKSECFNFVLYCLHRYGVLNKDICKNRTKLSINGLKEFSSNPQLAGCWSSTWSSLSLCTLHNFPWIPHSLRAQKNTHWLPEWGHRAPGTEPHSRTGESFAVLLQAIAWVLDGKEE